MAAKKNMLTPEMQALIMWALLVRENAGAYQSELKPAMTKPYRDALQEKGLITWWKSGGRKIWVEVTDTGWDWAGKNLSAPLSARSPAGTKIFEAWLAKLEIFIHARGFSLADVLGPQNGAPLAEPLNEASQQELAEPDATPSEASLRMRIRAAYLVATGGVFNKRALLKDIREGLKDVDRHALDEELKLMQREEQALLYPLDNRSEITEADRQAAISFVGEPRHILWIER